ncbi:MAG: Holliday junction resolvase RuvX [Bacteriovoracaceae bacterium]|jgi:putative holliday junction resolvase|nr:Holliday junction resolvase RuvX [Bacteriovoracaceae bacterium]
MKNSANYVKFKGLEILAIDYGTKIVGLGSFCPGNTPFPMPWGKLAYKNDDTLIDQLLEIIKREYFEVVVLGIPYYTDGKESDMTKRVKKFQKKLQSKLPEGVQLYDQDESLSSYEAEERMKSGARYNFKVDPNQIDALAAAIILEEFIQK